MSNRAIFLDRDDTLIEDSGYINTPEQVKLLDGAAEALVEFKKMGYKLVVVSNQSGIARGIFTEDTLLEIHNRLEHLLRQKDAYLDKIYYCPYLAEGVVEKYRKDSEDRKPNPGMLLKAAEELDIDLASSWMIGDGERDVEAGNAVGCKTIRIRPSSQTIGFSKDISKADHIAVNIREAVNIVKKFRNSPTAPPPSVKLVVPKEKEIGHQKTDAASKKEVVQQTKAVVPVETEQKKTDGAEPKMEPTNEKAKSSDRENTLSEILHELKALRRNDMFGDFSLMRLMAGIVQIVVLLCLLISVWILMNPVKENSSDSVLITLGFAGVLQIMALTFYMMQGRK